MVMAKLMIGGPAMVAGPKADIELFRRFVASRDEDAFAELVARFGPMVFVTCRRIVPDQHLAEDAFQAAFLVLATKAHQLDDRKPLEPWLYTVSCHVAMRARAMIRRRAQRERLVEGKLDVPADSRATDDAAAILDEEIGKLSPLCKEAVILCELQGLSRKIAAAKLGIAEGTLSSRLAAARKTLAERLRVRGVFGPLVITAVTVPPALASAAVGAADGYGSKVTQELAHGALRTMLISQLKRLSILMGVLLVLIGAGGWGGAWLHGALAALSPEPDAGLIWLHDEASGKLMGYSPEGKMQKELHFQGGDRFIGFTQDGANILYAANGKTEGTEFGDRPTLHLLDVAGATEGVDTGFAYERGDQFVFSPDGKKLVRQRLDRSAGNPTIPSYTHALIDVETGKETNIPLASNRQVMQWTADGQAWRVFECDLSKDRKNPKCRWWSVPVDGGEPSLLCDTHSLNWLQPSPEGDGFLATGSLHPHADAAGASAGIFRFDAAMGEPMTIKLFENAVYLVARGSPDSKRVICMRYDFDASRTIISGSQLVLLGADGRNEKTLLNFPGNTERIALVEWFPTRPKSTSFDPALLAVARATPATAQIHQPPVGQTTPIQLHAPKGDTAAARQLAQIFDAANGRLREAKPDEVGAILTETTAKIMAHARMHPEEETSLRGLVNAIGLAPRDSQTANTDAGTSAKIHEELFDVMKAKFATSPAIRPHLPYLANEFSEGARALVREVIGTHPDKGIRAYAAKEMIKALETQSRSLKSIAENKEIQAFYEKQIGKEKVKTILESAPRKISEYQQEMDLYRIALRTDLKGQLPDLEIGAIAPETITETPEGKVVKLSDLKGKVVVLDFWGVWCEPCRRLIPHSRELVKRFEGKPFAFVNICVRDEKATLAEFLKKEPMPWTHWWDPKAVIAQQWDIAAFPTLYVIDHKGVIQFMTRGYDPKTGALEKKIEELIKVAEGEK